MSYLNPHNHKGFLILLLGITQHPNTNGLTSRSVPFAGGGTARREKLFTLVMIYNGAKFELCDTHLLRLSKRLQFLPLPHKTAISNICLRQLWEARSTNETLRQFICNNREWFREEMVFFFRFPIQE